MGSETETAPPIVAPRSEPGSVIARHWSLVLTVAVIVGSAFVAREQISELRAQTAALEAWSRAHEKEHTVLTGDVHRIDQAQREHDAALRAVGERIQRIDVNLALVCQATKGAACQRP